MGVQNSTDIKGLPISIQCTWANCFTEPVWDKGLCIRSYDRKMLAKITANAGAQIGTLTGNYLIDETDVVWVEATLLFCNRRPTGWFRESDIYHTKKGVDKNPEDETVVPSAKITSPNWLAWLTAGVTAIKLITG